ncbi:hypothetical protein ACFL20_07440 [Spirochaetota bacterium]
MAFIGSKKYLLLSKISPRTMVYLKFMGMSKGEMSYIVSASLSENSKKSNGRWFMMGIGASAGLSISKSEYKEIKSMLNKKKIEVKV